ncbi:signal transducer CD24 [Sapajus apella]|uniref:Signal transducer CD24 n=1 Tax=Sapajus apella TaxID=9515 RepID=A0A6J3HLQ4_SAPAP|nr:signal transducer CD24 [Sapajus apella]
MRTRDALLSSQRPADTRRSQNKAGASGRARPLGRARRSLRTRAPPASPATLLEGLALGGARVPSARVPPARRAPHLACARPEPAVLQAPGIQRDAPRTDGGDMGRAMVARLGLGLLLLALLLPTQIYSNQTAVVTVSSNSSQSTSAAPSPANATTKAAGGALQSTASLFVVSLSLLHLYC